MTPLSQDPVDSISLAELLLKEFPPRSAWIGHELLPKGGKMLFGGPPKIGKSFVTNELAYSLVTGSPLFDYPTFVVEEPCRVLVVDNENGEREQQARLSISMKGVPLDCLERLHYVCMDTSIAIDTGDGLTNLCRHIDKVQPNVVVLDTLSSLHGSDENKNNEMVRIFNYLTALCVHYKALEMSVVIVHHYGKEPLDKKEYESLSNRNFRGAGRIVDAVDTILNINIAKRYNEGPHKWWLLDTCYTLRHAAPQDNLFISVNKFDDRRVRWEAEGLGGGGAKVSKPISRPLQLVKAEGPPNFFNTPPPLFRH